MRAKSALERTREECTGVEGRRAIYARRRRAWGERGRRIHGACRWWDAEGGYSDPDGGDCALEGSEDGFAEGVFAGDDLEGEERSADGEDESRQEKDEREGEKCSGPEESGLAAEKGCDEGDSNSEEGQGEVWDDVGQALSTVGREDYHETNFCVSRSQPLRSSLSSSSRASVLS